ncbi:hypothetical protein GCM10012319_18640 [Comamonas sp. KCTC 72670]|nr:hypothetical protein GCM10012319_18640 [Comamonas sp. KCTC 72670]
MRPGPFGRRLEGLDGRVQDRTFGVRRAARRVALDLGSRAELAGVISARSRARWVRGAEALGGIIGSAQPSAER